MMTKHCCELTENKIPYDYSLAGAAGGAFVLYPVRGEHTDEQVAAAKDWLRGSRDVVSIRVEWEKPEPADRSGVRTYASPLELLNAEKGLICVDQTHGLQVIDGMDGKTARKIFSKPVLLDAFTLSMLRQVYNALSEKNRAKMDTFSWAGAVEMGWKVCK
jgi:hypothetical protein